MSIEQTLAEINASLKTLVVIAQTGAAAPAELGTAATAAVTKAPAASTKKAAAAAKPATDKEVLDEEGNPAGTVYWIIEKHNTVYAQRPGDAESGIEGAITATISEYQTKKAEFAKKINAAAAQSSTAETVPSATAAVATVSNSDVPFKTVLDKLIEVSKSTVPTAGRAAVEAILTKYLADTPVAERKVPKLESVGKNAEILADAVAALEGAKTEEDALFG